MSFKWEVRKRLEEIERRLYCAGRLGRSYIIDKFGISPQQASADIAQYQKLASGNTEFNHSGKYYEPTAVFDPHFIDPSLADYITWRDPPSDMVAIIPTPLRSAAMPSLRAITLALHQGYSLQIEYQSMSSDTKTRRRITPHTIVYDGYRYHVRAYCHLRGDFRDFVLGRISWAGASEEPGLSKGDDDAWNTLIILRIGPHPGLNPSQREIIEHDFEMKGGELQLRVRQAMLLYTLTQLRLDRFTEERTPAEQQVVLLNPEILSYD